MRVCAGLARTFVHGEQKFMGWRCGGVARDLWERSDKLAMCGEIYFCEWIFLIMYVYVYKYIIMISE